MFWSLNFKSIGYDNQISFSLVWLANKNPKFWFVFSFAYYFNGIISIIIASIGIVINLVGITYLSVVVFRRKKRINFHKLVIFLAFWDLLILIMICGCFILPILSSKYHEEMASLMFRYAVPFTQILVTGSIYSTLALTLDR